MARKTSWYCDRCGKEFKRIGFTYSMMIPKQINLLHYNGLRCFSDREYDLCDDCFADLLKFIGGRKLEDGK